MHYRNLYIKQIRQLPCKALISLQLCFLWFKPDIEIILSKYIFKILLSRLNITETKLENTYKEILDGAKLLKLYKRVP